MNYESLSKAIRRSVIELAYASKGPHVGPSLSTVDILTVLYFKILRLDPWAERDVFLLSKAHAAMALYATLAERGLIDRKLLGAYAQNDGTLPAHLDREVSPAIEASAGALGHAFNMGLGWAFSLKRQGSTRQVYTLIGDGESQEGSIWEGALFAQRLGLDNFTAVMDHNNLQGYGRPLELCHFAPIAEKWSAFGWEVLETNGHDCNALEQTLMQPRIGKPRLIVARTKKGHGVSFMEDQLVWHYYIVTDKHRETALKELA